MKPLSRRYYQILATVEAPAPGRGNQLDKSRESENGTSDSGTGKSTEKGKGCQWKTTNGTFWTLSLCLSVFHSLLGGNKGGKRLAAFQSSSSQPAEWTSLFFSVILNRFSAASRIKR